MYRFEEPELVKNASGPASVGDRADVVKVEEEMWLGSEAFPSPPSAAPGEDRWITAAAKSALHAVTSHPLETGGGALLALLAVRCKAPALGELGKSSASLERVLARKVSPVPLVRSTRTLADEASFAADPSFVTPWITRPDQSGMNFSQFAPHLLGRDTVAIPTISVDSFKIGRPFTQEAFKIVPRLSAEARLYKDAKDATVRIWSNKSLGSGFFVDAEHIATADHVIRNATGKITVELANGKAVDARVVAREAFADWALLRVDEPLRLSRPFVLARAGDAEKGMHGFLIGHAHGGAEKVMTKGFISEMSVNSKTGLAFVNHTAETVSGMSGSPLLLENRKVLGVFHSAPAPSGKVFDGQATHVSHLGPALDYVRRVRNPDVIDWRTYAKMDVNERGIPQISINSYRDLPKA